jgi:hypothetical protein
MPAELNGVALPGLKFWPQNKHRPIFKHSKWRRSISSGGSKGASYTVDTIEDVTIRDLIAPGLSEGQLSARQRECFFRIMSGALNCDDAIPAPSRDSFYNGKIDWFRYSRELSDKLGMRRTRDILSAGIIKNSYDGADLENRIVAATRNPKLVYSGSIQSLSPARKRRIGFFLVLGFNSQDGSLRDIYTRLVAELRRQNFYARVLDTDTVASFRKNAPRIVEQINEDLPRLDEAVLFSASKGTQDMLYALTEYGNKISQPEKIKVSFSFSAAARGSQVAHWLTSSHSLSAGILRLLAFNPIKPLIGSREGVEALAEDVLSVSHYRLTDNFSHLKWASFVMIPPEETGFPSPAGLLTKVTDLIYGKFPQTGPYDTLVESGAQILPPDAGIKQSIVRAWGSHRLTDGYYVDKNKTPTSPSFQKSQRKDAINGSVDVLSAFLRSYIWE